MSPQRQNKRVPVSSALLGWWDGIGVDLPRLTDQSSEDDDCPEREHEHPQDIAKPVKIAVRAEGY